MVHFFHVVYIVGMSWNIVLITARHKTVSQGITVAANPERGVGNDPEPLGVAFLQGPSFTLMISLTSSHSSCLSLRLEILLH